MGQVIVQDNIFDVWASFSSDDKGQRLLVNLAWCSERFGNALGKSIEKRRDG